MFECLGEYSSCFPDTRKKCQEKEECKFYTLQIRRREGRKEKKNKGVKKIENYYF